MQSIISWLVGQPYTGAPSHPAGNYSGPHGLMELTTFSAPAQLRTSQTHEIMRYVEWWCLPAAVETETVDHLTIIPSTAAGTLAMPRPKLLESNVQRLSLLPEKPCPRQRQAVGKHFGSSFETDKGCLRSLRGSGCAD